MRLEHGFDEFCFAEAASRPLRGEVMRVKAVALTLMDIGEMKVRSEEQHSAGNHTGVIAEQ